MLEGVVTRPAVWHPIKGGGPSQDGNCGHNLHFPYAYSIQSVQTVYTEYTVHRQYRVLISYCSMVIVTEWLQCAKVSTVECGYSITYGNSYSVLYYNVAILCLYGMYVCGACV